MMKKSLAAVIFVGVAIGTASPAWAHHHHDDDGPSVTDEICGAYNLGVPPGDIPGRLGANDGRENYWRAQQQTRDAILGGDCG
jgi:hypothetical protein